MFTRSIFQISLRCNSSSSSAKDVASTIVNAEVKYPKAKQKDDKVLASELTTTFPEPPTTCCMSGCANCVWLDYVEKLSEYYKDGGEKAMKRISEEVTDGNMRAFLMHELRMRKKS
ncbi:PREDICTED: oxidoreductase-like domain-containing protein 1 [Nicrophorus vespilloides]|uniref:Oxidoreductase-like domain-containing protein 1 n=1 Tax=Nicrophorus vespilloides TaxID=110193 RepID=A0ABM1MBS3_NICVS|nr:PREDICTED: oxidoreductase-like domain-containing protein 1 [Nicrophorus vespilloides]